MRRTGRILGIGAACLVALLVVGYVGLKAYLSSGSAKRMASEQLTQLLGGPVRVTELSTGLVGTTAVAVEVLPGGGGDQPIVSGTVRVDTSGLGLATGGKPRRVTVESAHILLHLDKDGNVTDKLPEPKGGGGGGEIPAIEVRDATATVIQEGRPDFKIAGVNVTVEPNGQRFKIGGGAKDPAWGGWKLTGDWAADGSTGTARLETDGPVHVTPQQLESVPFVPKETWEWVRLQGVTPAALDIGRGADKKVTFRVELTPTAEFLEVPPIDLRLTAVTGKVVVVGPVVDLTGVKGTLADGTVDLDSVLDFGKEPSELKFKVKAAGLDIKKLPPKWGLPVKQFDEGRLKGDANITLVVDGGKVKPHGTGDAIVTGKAFGGEADAEVKLVGNGERLQFTSGGSKTSRRPADVISDRAAILLPSPLAGEGLGVRGRERPDSSRLSPSVAAFPLTPSPSPARGEGSKPIELSGPAATALLVMLLQAPPAAPATSPPAKKDAEPTYVQANLNLRDVDIAELIKRLNVPVPVAITGKVTLHVAAEIPVDATGTLRAYRVKGQLLAPTFGIQDLHMQAVSADIDFRDGVLSLTKLAAQFPPDAPGGKPGSFVGSAKYGVDPVTDLSADLKLDSIPLGQVFKAAPSLAGMASGPVSGTLTFKAPGKSLSDPATYVADGAITSPELVVMGRHARQLSLPLSLKVGMARLTDAAVVLEGLPIAATAAITLTDKKYPYTAHVKTTPSEVADLKKLIPEAELPINITGKVGATADVTGTFTPLTYSLGGTLAASDLVVGMARIDKVSTDWAVDTKAVTLKNLAANVYKGTITGSAKYPLAAAETGAFDVKFKDVDASAVSKAVPSAPVKLDGPLTGSLTGTLGAAKAGEQRPTTAALDLAAPRLRVNGAPTERLKGKLDLKPGEIDYALTGEAFGGTFDLNGTYPLAGPKPKDVPAAPAPKANPAPQGAISPPGRPEVAARPATAGGALNVRGLRLERLAGDLGAPSLAPLHGTVYLSLKFTNPTAGQGPTGVGRLTVEDLGFGSVVDDSDIRTQIRVTPEYIEIPDLTGRFAQGTLGGRVRYFLNRPDRSFYNLTLDGADAATLLAPLGLSGVSGRVTVTGHGNLGREPRGSGAVAVSRSKVGGFDLIETRIPYNWTYVPGSGGTFSVRDVSGQAAGGRVTGEASIAYGQAARVDGKFRFVGVSLRSVLGSTASSSGVGSSRMNGSLEFSGSDVRSFDDLSGLLLASIGEGAVLDTPAFSPLSQYLVPSFSARGLTSFTEGDLRARLNKGQVRVERFALSGSSSTLFLDGTVGARSGRLDLDVVASTRQVGVNAGLLRTIGLRIPAIGPIPVSLIVQASNLLSNRTIRARVTGTVKQPVVNVNLTGILTEEALRYLLQSYLPFSLPR